MRFCVALVAILSFCGSAFAQKPKAAPPLPMQFEIARRTFFDFGPPFNYYEILLVRPMGEGSSVKRITLTPEGDACVLPAKIEVASAFLEESVTTLLNRNPCAIPEKDLRRERKRCKKCNVFSGADVTMQVQCGPTQRLIHSAILDRDMFDSRANTPEHTSWTIQLLGRLDRSTGPGIMEKPAFPLLIPEQDTPYSEPLDSVVEQDLAAGVYDHLFEGARDRPSEIYRAAHHTPPPPLIDLQRIFPFAPERFVAPSYPPLAKMARAKGSVSFTVDVDQNGSTSNILIVSGSKLFYGVVRDAVAQWKFPTSATGAQVQGTFAFGLRCERKEK